MPLFFARADGATRNRNFSLVYNDSGQYFAVLYLLPGGHALGQPLNATQGNLKRLDTGEVFTSNSKTAILVPFEIGRNGWQFDKFVSPAIAKQVSIKTATLTKESEDYFLHVAFHFPEPPRYDPESYLGIDMGILFTAAYSVVDGEGQVLTIGHFEDKLRSLQHKHGRLRERKARNGKQVTYRDYKAQAYENILHVLANDIIAMAEQHKAMIAIEELGIQVRGSRVKSRFRKFAHILEYKSKLSGVPMRSVFAAYSSLICHKCGSDLQRDDRVVQCTHCGYTGHSDDNAAVNIARRAMYRKKDWPGGYREFHRSFADKDALTYQTRLFSQT